MLNFTPVFDKLKPELRSPENGRLAVILALSFVGFSYISFGELSIAYFGAKNIEQNVFTNFGRERDWLSLTILIWFIVKVSQGIAVTTNAAGGFRDFR